MTKRKIDKGAMNAIRLAGSVNGLAEKIGVTRQAVFYWSKSGIAPDKLPAVAKALGCKIEEIAPDSWIPLLKATPAPAIPNVSMADIPADIRGA